MFALAAHVHYFFETGRAYMKGVKDLILDDSPKGVKKIEKLLAKDPGSATYFEELKAEAVRATTMEFPKIRMMVTDSFVCASRLGFPGALIIVPIVQIRNIYRTNVIRNNYDFDNFTLAVETDAGLKFMASFPRTGAKSLDFFNEVIDAVKSRMALNGGAQI